MLNSKERKRADHWKWNTQFLSEILYVLFYILRKQILEMSTIELWMCKIKLCSTFAWRSWRKSCFSSNCFRWLCSRSRCRAFEGFYENLSEAAFALICDVYRHSYKNTNSFYIVNSILHKVKKVSFFLFLTNYGCKNKECNSDED